MISLRTKNKSEAERLAKEYLEPSQSNNEVEAAKFTAKAKGLLDEERITLVTYLGILPELW